MDAFVSEDDARSTHLVSVVWGGWQGVCRVVTMRSPTTVRRRSKTSLDRFTRAV